MRILFLDIDTLRPDHLGCYGYPRNTSPAIDSLCHDGMRFDQYYCSDAPCLPSRAALVSGMFGIRNGAVGHGGTAADRRLTGECRDFRDPVDDQCFHRIFRRAGYHTASISSFPERHSSWWFNAGFNECYNVGDEGMESGEKVLPVALDWLTRHNGEDNWFLHVHFWDPHTPYRAPADFGDPFEKDPLPRWITPEILEAHKKLAGPHSVMDLNMYDDAVNPRYPRAPGKAETMEELRAVFDGYDCGIRYCDSLIGQILSLLKQQGIYEDTAIILTADHGETMGELGIYEEHGTAYDATCRIPFLIKWPGVKPGSVDSGLHYSLDLLPTMAELLGVEKGANWDGESFLPSLLEGKDTGRDFLILSQMAHVCQRSARFDHWLYIRSIHDGYHLFDREMLFDLREDPHEQRDVKEQHPEICAQGARLILNWQEEQMKKSASTIDPMWTVMKEGGPQHTHTDFEKYLQRLRYTGRADKAERLRQKYPEK